MQGHAISFTNRLQTNFRHTRSTHGAHTKSPLVIPTFAADLCPGCVKSSGYPSPSRDSASLRRKSQENTSGNTPNGARSPPRPEIHPEAAPISGRRARPDKQAGLNPTGGARYYVDRASGGAVEEARLLAASWVAPNCGNRGSWAPALPKGARWRRWRVAISFRLKGAVAPTGLSGQGLSFDACDTFLLGPITPVGAPRSFRVQVYI